MKKFGKMAKAAADEAITHAMEAIQRGRPIDAERIIREVLAKDPRSLTGQHVLGRALLAQQRPQDAIAPLEAAARQGDPIAETNLGIALDQSGRPADALVWLERAVTRQPPFEHAFYELGSRLVSMRRDREAEGVLKRGLAMNPNSVELSILLGDIFLKRADRDSAKLAFARALANQPSHPGALFGMGTVMMLEGEYARAVQRLQQAVAQDPNKFQTRLTLGTCLLELQRWDEGLAALRSAIQQFPQAYAMALKILVTSGRGQFWLKPSSAAKLLRPAWPGAAGSAFASLQPAYIMSKTQSLPVSF